MESKGELKLREKTSFERMTDTMERVFLPIAHKVSQQRHLSAIKDGFIATMPLALVGALAVMFNNVFFGSGTLIGAHLNKLGVWASYVQPILDNAVIPVMGQLWWGTLAMSVLFSTFAIAYNLAKQLGEDGLIPGIAAVSAFLVMLPQGYNVVTEADWVWGAISWSSFNSEAVFTGLLTAMLSTEIYCYVKRKGWVIKMPDGVPPQVAKSFSAIIPAGSSLMLAAILSVIFIQVVGTPVKDWINLMLQAPLVKLGQSPISLVFLMILQQFLWFFGLHGMLIIEPALNLMYSPALNANMEAVMQGLQPVHAITRNFLDVYAMHGGSGSTLGLIIAIFLFSKKASFKTLSKMSLAPGIFQINEPMIYGLPLVLNPIMMIPFLFVPAINILVAWFFTAVIPFAGYLYIAPPWTTPPIVSAFLASGGNIGSTILAIATLALSVLMYTPFVILANKTQDADE